MIDPESRERARSDQRTVNRSNVTKIVSTSSNESSIEVERNQLKLSRTMTE